MITQRNFSRGELTPSLHARVDTAQYAAGLKTCRNARVLRMGGVQSRSGTQFVAEVKDSSKRVRLIPFVFNSSQTYVLEFGNEYMRVHQLGVQLTLTAQAITAITNADPCVVTYSGSDTYANGDEVYISGIIGPIGTYLNGRNFKVANVSGGSNTFELDYMDGTNVNSTSFGLYTSGGTLEEVYTITTPYVEADLDELNFIQSADVITIVHPNYAPRDLSRSGHTTWTLSSITFAPTIAMTGANPSASGTAGANSYTYAVSAYDQDTNEESLAFTGTTTNLAAASASQPHVIGWDDASGAEGYNIYAVIHDQPGFIGIARESEFTYYGASPNFSFAPPDARDPFGSASNYPSAVCYYQQRRSFANTDNNPETIYMSKTGLFPNFTTALPANSTDSITFTLAGGEVNEILHLINNGTLVALTGGGEWDIEGDDSGIISIGAVNARQKGYYGACAVRPVVIGSNIVYVDASQSIVRDILPKFQDIEDLTLFSTHLFDDYTITDMTFQKSPHPTVWAIRSDGTLLGLTYVRNQEILAWHRHDTEGTFENVCAVPEGSESFLYVVVNRTIDGSTKRYIERMSTRQINNIEDFIAMDAALTYDGTNATAYTMTLSGGTDWLETETLTCTLSNAAALNSSQGFLTTDVGNEVHFFDSDGELLGRFEILTRTNATVVTGRFDRTVPVALRSSATTTWGFAVDELSGLWHLEGEDVSVFADGAVLASPNNSDYDTVTVSDGAITLDTCHVVIHVGEPFVVDIETLDIDSPNSSLANKKKRVNEVTLHLEETRGVFAGPSEPSGDGTTDLRELKLRNTEGYDEPTNLFTGKTTINIQPKWNSNGRVFLRQVDPIPMTILAITSDGELEGRE